jgi:hypothetical protein
MVNYKCFRCGYETKHKANFITHLNRKNICSPTLDDVCIEEIQKWYKIGIHKNVQQVKPVFEQVKPVLDTVCEKQVKPVFKKNGAGKKQVKPAFDKNSTIFCDYCGKFFSRTYGLTCHLKTCKTKQQVENEKDRKIEELIQNQEKMKEEMKNMVEKLLINSSINTTNNYHNNSYNNSNNTINNTIHINNYGNENIDYLQGDYLTNLLQGAFTAIPKLIENIHFNPQHPENHNIKITNKKEPYVKIRKNDKWELQDKKETLETLVDDKYYILEDHYADVEDKNNLPSHTKEVMKNFRDKFNDDIELQKDLQKKSEIVIINNS